MSNACGLIIIYSQEMMNHSVNQPYICVYIIWMPTHKLQFVVILEYDLTMCNC